MAEQTTRRCECLWGSVLDDDGKPVAPCPAGHYEDGCTRDAEERLLLNGEWTAAHLCQPCARAWEAEGDWRPAAEVVEESRRLAALAAGLTRLIAVDELLRAAEAEAAPVTAQAGSTAAEMETAVEWAKLAELAAALKAVAATPAARDAHEDASLRLAASQLTEAYLDGAFDDR